MQTKRNVSTLPKNKCYGCGACLNICPELCISMIYDDEGFLYPQVEQSKCIECDNCIQTCPGFNDVKFLANLNPPDCYGGMIENDEIRYLSSSGGIFSFLARKILDLRGVVYGAIYNFKELTVEHSRAQNKEDLALLRKSKYVQSDTKKVFNQIKNDLMSKLPVLFSGTPCQVEGLYLFLGKDYENLFTCDVICKGVPSPGLFKKHFSLIEKRIGENIVNVDFRTKIKGWGGYHNFFMEIEFDSKRIIRHAIMDAYYSLFLSNISLRPCCFQCKYTSILRKSDITLGDYWGVQKSKPELFDGKGTSLILANTAKGKDILNSIRNSPKIEKINIQNALQNNLMRPSPYPKFRKIFFNNFQHEQYKKHRNKNHMIAILTIIKNKLRSSFRNKE